MIFDLTSKKLISYDQGNSEENLRQNFIAFIQGLISFPLDIPGTAYHKCLQVSLNQLHELVSMKSEFLPCILSQCGNDVESLLYRVAKQYGLLLFDFNSCKLFSG